MRVENHGFFYYEKNYEGDGAIAPDKKAEFLKKYYDFCRKTYMIPPYSVKACPEKEADELNALVGVSATAPRLSEVLRGKYSSPLLNREVVSNIIDITDIRVKTLFAKDKSAKIELSFKTSEPCDIKVYIAPAWPRREAEKLLGEFSIEGEFSEQITLENINLWSAETPELYDIRVVADDADDRIVETGFRTVERKDGKLFVNGKDYYVKGALIEAEKKNELSDREIIWHYLMVKRMQANAVAFRLSDYEGMDIRFARLADRLGVMLICEGDFEDLNHPSLISSNLLESVELSFEGGGRADPDSKEALALSGKESSGDDEWRLFQADEALKAREITVLSRTADKTNIWYNLTDDFNGPIDRLGYAKCGYYVMQESFKKATCINKNVSRRVGEGFKVCPILFGEVGDSYAVTVAVTDEKGLPVAIKTYGDIECTEEKTILPEWQPSIKNDGYYSVKAIIIKTF